MRFRNVRRRTVCSDRVTVMRSPLLTEQNLSPSEAKKPPSAIVMVTTESVEATIGRKRSVCAQIGVSTIAFRPSAMIGPPAESEYPVAPIVVATMIPSAVVLPWTNAFLSSFILRRDIFV